MDEAARKRRIRIMTVGSFFAFFTFGCIDVLKGATLPALLGETGYSYSLGGLIVLTAYLGFAGASLATGCMADTEKRKGIVILAACCYLGGISIYGAAFTLPLFFLGSFLIGFACGSAEVGANVIIIDLQRSRPGLFLNLLTACYGLGCMLAPLYAGIMFRNGHSWRSVYFGALGIPLALLVYFLLARYPTRGGDSQTIRPAIAELIRGAFTPAMRWLYLLSFSYVAAEVGIATWLVEYLRVEWNLPAEYGTVWLSVYFAGIMIGRGLGGFVVERVGYVRSIAFAIVACIVCIVLGISGLPLLSLLLPLTGLFLSIILPTATALVSTMGTSNTGAILGLFFFFVGLGGMAGPWAAGLLNSILGLRSGMAVAAFFCLLMLLALARIKSCMARQSQ